MSIRRTGPGHRATRTAWVVATGTAVAAVLAVTAPSASAYVACPTWPSPAGSIEDWATKWPAPGANPKGVTLCQAQVEGHGMGYLTILDLRDGAKLRLVSQVDPGSPIPRADRPYTEYKKRTASSWYSYIRSGGSYISPDPSRLFSTTNASFFNTTANGVATTLPFPHRFNQGHETWGSAMVEDWGASCPNPEAFDYCATKKLLRIGTPSETPQKLGVTPMFRVYDSVQAQLVLQDGHRSIGESWPGAADATVAFDPLTSVGSASRRNYIGKYGNVVYLFTSTESYTNAQAAQIMQDIQPGMSVMQLDGGGSAQMHSAYGTIDSVIPDIPFGNREVADVLAVYTGP